MDSLWNCDSSICPRRDENENEILEMRAVVFRWSGVAWATSHRCLFCLPTGLFGVGKPTLLNESTLLNDDQRTVDDETVTLDDPTDRTDDPDDVGDDDDDAGRDGRADVVAIVGIVDEIHDGAVEHLVIGDDGDDTDDARWNGCDGWEVWVTRDGDGEQEGGDGHRKAVADVDPKTPRRVLNVRRIQARVLRKDYGPVLERKRLRYCDVIEQTQRRKHLTIAIGNQ